jgi:hypothetical protein
MLLKRFKSVENSCLFIDGSTIDGSSGVMCWARDHGTTHWTLNGTLISRSPVPTSFRKWYHFQPTTIVLRACSLLVDRDPYHPRRRGEPTLISFYSPSHRSGDGDHSTTKKQTFETPHFATNRSIDPAR